MTALLNLGRLAMGAWVAYGLLLIFTPGFIHRAPDPKSGAIQAVVAYLIGYLLDRALGAVRRRRSRPAVELVPTCGDTGTGVE